MNMDKTRVLVTGASGFIATHVVKLLIQKGFKVRGTVRSLKNETKVKPVLDLGSAENPVELCEADLNDDTTWLPAVKGCDYVLHIATPAPASAPHHEDDIIKPAVEGVLSVLRACSEDGNVKRVVLTSSTAAIHAGVTERKLKPWNEEDWTDTDHNCGPAYAYQNGKTLQEKAAWDFMRKLPGEKKFELAVLNPAVVNGPILCGSFAASMVFTKMLLQKEALSLPKIGFAIVDVRDVAEAHVIAMTLPEAAGKRHILATKSLWFKDFAFILKEEFESQGYNVPTSEAPNFIMKMMSWFINELKPIAPGLGQLPKYDNFRMKNILGIPGRDPKSAILDMAYAMIEAGHIKKTDQYTGPKYSE